VGPCKCKFRKFSESGASWADEDQEGSWQKSGRLDGNPSRRLIEESGIEALGEPFIPEHLCDDARGCIEVIKQSMPSHIYSTLDNFILAAFGTAWAIHRKAVLAISDPNFKWIDKSKRGAGVESGAWIKIARQQATLMASLGDHLGLDPKSRGTQDARRETAEEQIRGPARAQLGFDELKKLRQMIVISGNVVLSKPEEVLSLDHPVIGWHTPWERRDVWR
jgi:phage terminase small subunit